MGPFRAVEIIRDEHLAIASVLYSLRYLTRRIRDMAEPPDFRLLRAMLDYVVAYPDRWHHPKENDYLFRALARRDRRSQSLIDELTAEHVDGGRRIDELKGLLLAFEAGVPEAMQPFACSVESYTEFEWEHMRKEDEILIPRAERVLPPEDWADIGQAFEENDNPLFGIKPREQAEALYQRILSLAPAPIGYRDQG